MEGIGDIVEGEKIGRLRRIDENEVLDVLEHHIGLEKYVGKRKDKVEPFPPRYKCGINDDEYKQTALVELECLKRLLLFSGMELKIFSQKLDPDKE